MESVYRFLFPVIYFFAAGMPVPLSAQDYFKQLAESDQYFRQRITHFPNGDLLIGDSSIEALRIGSGGKIYITRMDECGQVLWSRSYERREEYLEFKDFQINTAGDIFVYGSAYLGLDEFIFLMKLSGVGNIIDFRLFEPETVDHFSYAIDLRENQLMAYGLILDFDTKKYGFVAMFDHNLNFQWGVKFSPFESSGDARITQDKGFICRSGAYLFKLTASGQLEWAHTLVPTPRNTPIGGPLEVNDGYILEAYGEGLGFFYKIDLSGNLLWKSEQFPTKSFAADMSLLPDGRVLAVHSDKDATTHYLNYLILSRDGQILQQQQLQTGLVLQPGRIYQSLGTNNTLAVSVNFDPFPLGQVDVAGFLLQSVWPPAANDCFHWEDRPNTQINNETMEFLPLDTVVFATNMELYSNPVITRAAFASPLSNACAEAPDQMLVQQDTLLACGDSWSVTLPAPEFAWTDGQTDNPRLLRDPGLYEANNQDCGNLITYTYQLEKPDCACLTYLPTAFSPNQDGQNDELKFFSDCTLTDIHFRIFNRWGEQVFESRVPDHFWDGRFRGQPAPNGLYMVLVDFNWQDQDGQRHQGAVHQAVTLLR